MTAMQPQKSFPPRLVRTLITMLWVILMACHIVASAQPRADDRDSIRVVPGFVVIKFKPDSTASGKPAFALSTALAQRGVESLTPMFRGMKPLTPAEKQAGRTDISRITLATIPMNLDPVRVAADLSQLQEVEYAEPRYSYPLLDVPNDSLISSQDPSLSRMNAFAGWSIAKGDSSVVIATVDGGTYWQHEDIAPNLWINKGEDINNNGRFDPTPAPAGDEDWLDSDGNGYVDDVIGWNFTNNSNDPNGLPSQPINSAHGTSTASLFGAATNNFKGIAGTSWNCRVMPICAADGSLDDHILFGLDGLIYASQNGASVINISWGGYGTASKAMQDVINAVTEKGSLIVAAAGNSNANNDAFPVYPASYIHVLSVGATYGTNDGKFRVSNFGNTVPVFAPGVGIWRAKTDGTYGPDSGTSVACPLVAGLAGLLKSAHPSWTPAQIAAQIRVTADSIDDVPANANFKGMLGRGRVNFGRALSETGHAGIEITQALFHSGWRTLFFSGDSLALSLTVRNVLFAQATNLKFTVTSLDNSVTVLNGVSSPMTLQPGEEATLPDFSLKIGTVADRTTVVIRLAWVSNGNDRDLTAFRILVDPSRPSWVVEENPSSSPLRSVKAVNRYTAWAIGGNGTPTVLRTADAGLTWTDVTGSLRGGKLTCVEALDTSNAWCGSDSVGIVATTDGGSSWVAQTYGGRQASSLCGIKFFDPLNGVAMGNPPKNQSQFVVLTTSDGGTTWTHRSSEPSGVTGEVAGANSFCWIDPRHGWFGTNQSRIWRTTDGGQTWAASPAATFWTDPPATARIFAVSFADSLIGLAYHPYPCVVRTTNGGATWAYTGVPSVISQSESEIAFAPGSTWAWAGHGQSMSRSTDDGSSWPAESLYPVRGALQHLSVASTQTSDGVTYSGWAVTDSGEILHSEFFFVNVATRPAALPGSFTLEQNYPNPFNPKTVIGFQLPVASTVELVVYDLLGRVVAKLVDGVKPAGTYSLDFDGRNLASGVYVCRLSTGGFSQSRKMLLIR